MPRFTASWTNTETTDWEAGDYLRYDKFRDQIGQNMEYMAQTHKHAGNPGDGGFLSVSDPKYIWFVRPNGAAFS